MLDTIYLSNDKTNTEYTAEEIVSSLVHLLPREALLSIAALRVAGFSHVSTGCAALAGIESAPETLGRVVELFSETSTFASLVDEVVGVVSKKALRSVWASLRNGYAVSPKDVLLVMNSKLVDLAEANPIAPHKKERAANEFNALVTSKLTGGNNQAPFEGWSVVSH